MTRTDLTRDQLLDWSLTASVIAAIFSEDDKEATRQALATLVPNQQGDFTESVRALYGCFQLDVYPVANIYLNDVSQAGGDAAQALEHLYEEAGLDTPEFTLTADHFARMFRALSALLKQQAESQERQTQSLDSLSSTLVASFLAPSVFPFAQSLLHQKDDLSRQFGYLLLCFIRDVEFYKALPATQFDVTPPLDKSVECLAKGDLEDIVSFLTSPSECGAWVSKEQIRAIAADCELPCGFSTRNDMLTNLFHSAGTYGETTALMEGLGSVFAKNLEGATTAWKEIESIQPILCKLERSNHLLQQLRRFGLQGPAANAAQPD